MPNFVPLYVPSEVAAAIVAERSVTRTTSLLFQRSIPLVAW